MNSKALIKAILLTLSIFASVALLVILGCFYPNIAIITAIIIGIGACIWYAYLFYNQFKEDEEMKEEK